MVCFPRFGHIVGLVLFLAEQFYKFGSFGEVQSVFFFMNLCSSEFEDQTLLSSSKHYNLKNLEIPKYFLTADA